MHEVAQLVTVGGARFQRSPVNDDARRTAATGRQYPREWDHRPLRRRPLGERRHVLDRELDIGELPAPSVVQVLDGIEDEVVEHLGPGSRERYAGGHEWTAQPAAVPVPPPTSPRGA